jgi:hypothetical protein
VWCGVVWCGVVWCGVVRNCLEYSLMFHAVYYVMWFRGMSYYVFHILSKIIFFSDKVKDIKLLQEDLSSGMRHQLLKSSNLDAITNVLQLNGLLNTS